MTPAPRHIRVALVDHDKSEVNSFICLAPPTPSVGARCTRRLFATPAPDPTDSAHKVPKPPLGSEQNVNHFLASIFDPFWDVLGRHLGVILRPCEAKMGQVGSKTRLESLSS